MSKENFNPDISGGGEAAAQLPVPVPNENFTIANSRLAGSTDCLNCGTGLQGPFCHYCGQPDKNLMRFFPALLREGLTGPIYIESISAYAARNGPDGRPLLYRIVAASIGGQS